MSCSELILHPNPDLNLQNLKLPQASLSLRPGGPLAASEATLEEAHGMWVPPTSAGVPPAVASGAVALRQLESADAAGAPSLLCLLSACYTA